MATRTIVVGGGTAGLACARSLARQGDQVEVLERHTHVHEHGSHSGHTRVIRQAYHEGARYVPLVLKAEAAWLELERERNEPLLVRTGLLEFGAPDDLEYRHSIEALRAHDLPHTEYTGAQASARWPFEIPSDWEACLSDGGGYLRVAACLDALRDDARAHGATFRYGARVREILPGGTSPRVLLEAGDVLAADRVVVAAGAFAQALMPWLRSADRRLLVRPQRRVLAWRRPAPDHDEAALRDLPVWGAFTPEGFFYGFPLGDEGVSGLKLACHQPRGSLLDGDSQMQARFEGGIDPDAPDRTIDEIDRRPLDAFIARYFPAAAGPEVHAGVCMYASTASGDFLISPLREDPRVMIVGGLSGHGFKFAPALGDLVADAYEGREEALDGFRIEDHRGWT